MLLVTAYDCPLSRLISSTFLLIASEARRLEGFFLAAFMVLEGRLLPGFIMDIEMVQVNNVLSSVPIVSP